MSGNTPEPRRPRRWMGPALAVSLALNLLVAGAVAGAWMSGHRQDEVRRVAVDRMIGRTPFVAALDPDDRREVLRELRREAEPLARNRADLRARLDALLEALRAETFDRAQIEALIAEQRQIGARRMEIGEAALIDRIAAMSLEERRAYADRLDRSIRRVPRQ